MAKKSSDQLLKERNLQLLKCKKERQVEKEEYEAFLETIEEKIKEQEILLTEKGIDIIQDEANKIIAGAQHDAELQKLTDSLLINKLKEELKDTTESLELVNKALTSSSEKIELQAKAADILNEEKLSLFKNFEKAAKDASDFEALNTKQEKIIDAQKESLDAAYQMNTNLDKNFEGANTLIKKQREVLDRYESNWFVKLFLKAKPLDRGNEER